VVFVPHPDDEAYAFAGTMAALTEADWRVRVVCLTRGEGGVDRRGPNADLAATRVSELKASFAIVGAQVEVLDLPDGRVSESDLDLTPWARDASIVLTLGDDGVYGHPDHLACTRLVGAATFEAPLLHAAFPRGHFAPVHRALSRFMPLERSAEQLGTTREHVFHVADVRRYRALKRASIGAHRSQLRDGEARSFLRRGLIDGLLDEEWFVLAGRAG